MMTVKNNQYVEYFIEEEVRQLASCLLAEDKIDIKCPITEYGLDSLGFTLLLCNLEQKLKITFQKDIFMSEFHTLENILEKCNEELRCKDAEEKRNQLESQ